MALVAGDDESDLDVVVQEGHEFGPGGAPHAGDRGVSLVELVGRSVLIIWPFCSNYLAVLF